MPVKTLAERLGGEPTGDTAATGTGTGTAGTAKSPGSMTLPARPLAGLTPTGTPATGTQSPGAIGAFAPLGSGGPGSNTANSPSSGQLDPATAGAVNQAASQDAGLYTVGANLVTNYQNGTLPPGMMTYINSQQQEQIDELTQQFNSMGIGTDTPQYQSAVDQIKNNTVGVVAQQLNQEYANGMSAFGLDSSLLQYVEGINDTIYTGQNAANVAGIETQAGRQESSNDMIASLFQSESDYLSSTGGSF